MTLRVCCRVISEVVSSKDGLWLSVAITVGMALVIGIAQPFAQPQVNALQTTSFACALDHVGSAAAAAFDWNKMLACSSSRTPP